MNRPVMGFMERLRTILLSGAAVAAYLFMTLMPAFALATMETSDLAVAGPIAISSR